MRFYIFYKRRDPSVWSVAIRRTDNKGHSGAWGRVKLERKADSEWGRGFFEALLRVMTEMLDEVSQQTIAALRINPQELAKAAASRIWKSYHHDFESTSHVEIVESALKSALARQVQIMKPVVL